MTQNRRLFINVIATYGRSLYALAIGVFTARWTLMALGAVDYGLVGVVGGLVGFVAFLNNLLASAVSRFYGISVGAAKCNKGGENAALYECRSWFTVAVLVHTVLSVILIVIGYPCGIWAVEHFLTIPPDRVQDCVWVWRFTCVSCFLGMVNVPFSAMYNAKQEIAELTIYSFFTTTANACFLYYMITHPGIWLAKYALWTCLLGAVPQVIIMLRASYCYKECRLIANEVFNQKRIMEIWRFAFARCLAELAGVFAGQGTALIVNKYFGPVFNAAVSLGNSVAGHCTTLSSSVSGAFYPLIVNKTGEGAFDEVRVLGLRASRLSSVMILLFAIPLSLEIREVLKLWLVQPPAFVAEICVAILVKLSIEATSDGYWMSILSRGKSIVKYSMTVCWAGFVLMGSVWLAFALGFGMLSICVGFLLHAVWLVGWRIYWGGRLCGVGMRMWFGKVFSPLLIICLLTCSLGFSVRFIMEASFLRVIMTTLICEVFFMPAVYFLVLDSDERRYLNARISAVMVKRGFDR